MSPVLQMTGKNTGGATCIAGDVGEEHGERETTAARGEGAGAARGCVVIGGAPSPEGATVEGGAATRGTPSPEGAAAHYKVLPLMPCHMIATPLIWLP